MSNLPAPDRRYSEKEVSRLLKRAAELQRASPSSPNPGGLSLQDLEEIATEAGLDVTLLRQAARELDARGPVGSGPFDRVLGGPLRIVLERTLPFEAPESSFEAVIAHIQMAATSTGQATQIGRTLTWQKGGNSTVELQVVISARRGETLIRIEERHGQFAGALFGGGIGGTSGIAIGAGGVIGGTAGSVLLAVGAPIALLGAAYGILRTIYANKSRSRQRTLAELMEKITAELTMAAESPG